MKERIPASHSFGGWRDFLHQLMKQILLFLLLVSPIAIAMPSESPEPKETHTVRSMRGWTVYVNDRLLNEEPDLGERALELLSVKLFDINFVIPARALKKLHAVKIWLDKETTLFPGCVYHPSPEWLREHGCDPQKANSVHIANASNFLSWSLDQPAMILHEMAHAYHHQVLGYDFPEIKAAYRRALDSRTYESVLYCRGDMKRAYALNNDQEYFAELTEAFFSVNDYYPFVRAEVKQHDPEMFQILQKVWEE